MKIEIAGGMLNMKYTIKRMKISLNPNLVNLYTFTARAIKNLVKTRSAFALMSATRELWNCIDTITDYYDDKIISDRQQAMFFDHINKLLDDLYRIANEIDEGRPILINIK